MENNQQTTVNSFSHRYWCSKDDTFSKIFALENAKLFHSNCIIQAVLNLSYTINHCNVFKSNWNPIIPVCFVIKRIILFIRFYFIHKNILTEILLYK